MGYVAIEPLQAGRRIDGCPVLGTLEDLERLCRQHQIDEVVVGPDVTRRPRSARQRSLRCLRLGCRVTNLSTFYEQVLSEVPVSIARSGLVPVRRPQALPRIAAHDQTCGRHFGALLGLLISCRSGHHRPVGQTRRRGPDLLPQRRVGLNGRHFTLLQVPHDGPLARRRTATPGPSPADPRVTRLGASSAAAGSTSSPSS